MKVTVLGLLAVWLLTACHTPTKEKSKENAPYLVVLSMDGFRWDYSNMYNTPNLDSIARVGVKAKSLIPSFPSKTFPNHYTIATGLYPEHHGIVLNTFTDPAIGDYKLSDRKAVQNPDFYLGEPIWVTAENQGLRTACYYWPGSEAPIKGVYPSIWKKYDATVTYENRIDSVFSWLQLPSGIRPHLILWYFDEPDHIGHLEGPFAKDTKTTVERLDSLVGVFCHKINQLPNADSINLVFLSDHGMGQITKDKSIALAEYLHEDWVESIRGGNPLVMLKPFEQYTDTVWSVLSSIPHMKVYSKETMPDSFHYTESNRILDYVCVADSAYALFWKNTHFVNGGTHGYDPSDTDVHAIFYGSGPALKEGYVSESFPNVDLYPLFARILNLEPAETDGSLAEVESVLKN